MNRTTTRVAGLVLLFLPKKDFALPTKPTAYRCWAEVEQVGYQE